MVARAIEVGSRGAGRRDERGKPHHPVSFGLQLARDEAFERVHHCRQLRNASAPALVAGAVVIVRTVLVKVGAVDLVVGWSNGDNRSFGTQSRVFQERVNTGGCFAGQHDAFIGRQHVYYWIDTWRLSTGLQPVTSKEYPIHEEEAMC